MTQDNDQYVPSLAVIILYVGLHEFVRRFFSGPLVFAVLRTIFLIFVALYYKRKQANLRQLFGLRPIQQKDLPWLGAFTVICVVVRIIVHYQLPPTTDFVPLIAWKGSTSTIDFDLGPVIEQCVICPVNEELLFRGLFLSTLLANLNNNSLYALFLSSLLFANAHDVDAQKFVVTFAGAMLVYGPAYLRLKSVYACIFLHALWNALLFVPWPAKLF